MIPQLKIWEIFLDWKKVNGTTIKDIRTLFRLKKENKTIKEWIIRDVRDLFKYEEGDCYKPVRAGNFLSNSHIEYKSKGDRKTPSVEKYINKI